MQDENVVSVEHTVPVWGKSYVVTVYQESKRAWIAVGDYMGERIEIKGSSEFAAVAHWRKAARYKGD